MVSSKKSPRALKGTPSTKKMKRLPKAPSTAATAPSSIRSPAGVKSTRKVDRRHSRGENASDSNPNDPGSPTVVINKEMTAGKRRLLESSPLKEILSKSNEKTTASCSVPGESKESVERVETIVHSTTKVRKLKSTEQGPATPIARSTSGDVNTELEGSSNKPSTDSKLLSRKVIAKSKIRLSKAKSPSKVGIEKQTVVEIGQDRDRAEKPSKKERAADLNSSKNPKRESIGKTTNPSAVSSPSGSVLKPGSKGKPGFKRPAAEVLECSETVKVDQTIPDTREDENLEKSAVDSFLKDLLDPAKENDDASPVHTADEKDAGDSKEVKVQKRGKERNRANKRALLHESTNSNEVEAQATEGNEKAIAHKVIKKKRGDAKKAKKAMMKRDVEDQLKLKEATHKVKTAAKAKDNEAGSDEGNSTPGVMYLGHIPHGFYEKQMAGFFSQFGRVLRVRVSRSWRTGKSSGFGFVKFADKDVAVIAAEAMDGYLMHGRRLKANFVPADKVHKDTFKPKTRGEKSMPISELERRNLLKRSGDPQKVAARSRNIKKEISRKKKRLARLGMNYAVPDIAPSMPLHQNTQQVPTAINEASD